MKHFSMMCLAANVHMHCLKELLHVTFSRLLHLFRCDTGICCHNIVCSLDLRATSGDQLGETVTHCKFSICMPCWNVFTASS